MKHDRLNLTSFFESQNARQSAPIGVLALMALAISGGSGFGQDLTAEEAAFVAEIEREAAGTSSAPVIDDDGVAVVDTSDTLDTFVVIGSTDAVFNLPGSGFYLDTTAIQDASYLNVNRILAKVPGVYVREEDGFGLFPNISIRGGDGTRSEKLTIMEDGILTAPAPYAAPSAYYSPNAARMSGIEILKGSSQVRYGPHTTGGVINYLSTPIPEDMKVFFRTTYGSDNTVLSQANVGDVIEGDFGRFGYLAELWWSRSDGFRTIDGARGLPASDKTGFNLIEPMFKFFWEPNSDMPMRFEGKYGYTELDADETYTGLTEADLIRTPYRRYAGTYLDNISTEHHRSYLKWIAEPGDDLTVEVAGYYNKFARNWYKIRKAGGESLHTILANPVRFSDAFDNLRLMGRGDLDIRANARTYEAYGVHAIADYRFETGEVAHVVNVGGRYHTDYIRRRQRDDKIVVGGSAPFVTRGKDGSGGNRFQLAKATSVWIEDEMTVGRLSVKPGVRYETVDMEYTDYRSDSTDTPTAFAEGSTDIFAPGVGLTFDLTDRQTLFGGVYKGISAPSPRNHLRSGVDWEESIGYELGARHNGENGLYAEVAGFLTDFENLTGTAAGLGLDGAGSSNAGEAEVYGVEALASYDIHDVGASTIPLFASATYTNATLKSALSEGGGDNVLAGGVPGAALPYVPEWKAAIGTGIEGDRWGIDVTATYVSDTFGTAANLHSPDTTSRQGKIDGGVVVDLGAHFQVSPRVKLIGGIHNLLDEQLTGSRIPEGPRIGAPRTYFVGFEIEWEPSQAGIDLEK
ncbi:MAG: TonB-dependent receptor [Verrucomicrobiales bacterium]|nr:TonB-dependent receptor [Verrucomicrobiales bacterium]